MVKIFGVGTDIIELERFTNTNIFSLASRILTQSEIQDFLKSKNQINFIAKRFSVKEAISKAFGVGIGKKLRFKDIEITKSLEGKPICIVHEVKSFAITGQKVDVHVSISDSKSMISTYCIVEILG